MALNDTWPDYFRSPSLFAAEVLGLTPHETQSAFLECPAQTKVAACGRRWGKSTAAAIDLIHLAVVGIDGQPTKQMVVAPTGDQYSIICDEVESLLLNSPLASQVERIVHSPFFEVRLRWGSRILGRSAGETGRNLRGRGVHRVVIDEAAFIPEQVIQTAIIPMLADYDGQLVLISSPFGRNVFWEYFVRGEGDDPRTASFHCPSHLNPHISHAYIEAQRETMTDLQFRAEWLAEFLDDQSTVFKWTLIERAIRGDLAAPLEQHRYGVGWDPAKYNDRSAVISLDVTALPWSVALCEGIQGRDYTLQVQRVSDVATAYYNAPVRMDCTGNAALLEQLRARHRRTDGLTFTNANKQEIIDGVVLALEHDELAIPRAATLLLQEMRYYEYTLTAAGNVKLGAPDRAGAHDDFVTALALAVSGARAHRYMSVAPPAGLTTQSKWRGIGEPPAAGADSADDPVRRAEPRATTGQQQPFGQHSGGNGGGSLSVPLARPSKWRV